LGRTVPHKFILRLFKSSESLGDEKKFIIIIIIIMSGKVMLSPLFSFIFFLLKSHGAHHFGWVE